MSPATEMKKVTIMMPAWMLDDLRARAEARGISVTELMRRAVSVERMMFEDDDNEVILRSKTKGTEQVVRLL